MESALTDIEGKTGVDVMERYVGPDAWWIANLLSDRIRFERDWFWTKAFCHGEEADELAFRQRPDGNGIDVHCHAGSCSPELAADGLGAQVGWPIRSSYEPLAEPVDRLWRLREWPWERLAWYGVAGLVFAAPLLVGLVPQAAILNCLGYTIGSWLMGRLLLRRPARRPSR